MAATTTRDGKSSSVKAYGRKKCKIIKMNNKMTLSFLESLHAWRQQIAGSPAFETLISYNVQLQNSILYLSVKLWYFVVALSFNIGQFFMDASRVSQHALSNLSLRANTLQNNEAWLAAACFSIIAVGTLVSLRGRKASSAIRAKTTYEVRSGTMYIGATETEEAVQLAIKTEELTNPSPNALTSPYVTTDQVVFFGGEATWQSFSYKMSLRGKDVSTGMTFQPLAVPSYTWAAGTPTYAWTLENGTDLTVLTNFMTDANLKEFDTSIPEIEIVDDSIPTNLKEKLRTALPDVVVILASSCNTES